MLGKALLWAVFDPIARSLVLAATVTRIQRAYQDLTGEAVSPTTVNPIRRAHLLISGDEDRLLINEAFAEGDGGDDDNATPGAAAAATAGQAGQAIQVIAESMQNVHAAVRETRRDIAELKQEYESMRTNLYTSLGQIRSSLNRLSRAPTRVGAAGVAIPAEGGPREIQRDGGAFLIERPKSLAEIWQEYDTGVNGNKAARLFTPAERGRVRKKYSRRNLAWTKIEAGIRAGRGHQEAIDELYSQYGASCTVTQILNKISSENNARRLSALADVMVEERIRMRRAGNE